MTQAVFERLRQADEQLRGLVEVPASLRPGASQATSLESLGRRLLVGVEPDVAAAFAEGMASIIEAQIDSFPETLFWDVDFMAAEILAQGSSDRIDALCGEIAALQQQYGRNSVLAFRYVHDFSYGYDWAKWVAREPAARQGTRPFDPTFIAYLRQRGDELVELIAQDDEKYPKLPNGKPRNPFGFSREPEHERALFCDLAAAGLLPVEAWNCAASPSAQRPYADLRSERACKLGVPMRGSSRE